MPRNSAPGGVRSALIIAFLLTFASLCPAAEPIRLYTVQVQWLAGPTLTAQAPVVDRWTFAGPFKLRHLREELEKPHDELAWNVKSQIKVVTAKLALLATPEHDLMDDTESVDTIQDLQSFGCLVNYRRPVLTIDVPCKVGKSAGTVRILVERGADGIRVEP